jgi:hypothetical protein
MTELATTNHEAHAAVAMAVAKWCALMVENKLTHASFRIDTPGMHDERTSIGVGAACDLLALRGYEVLSHAAFFVNDQRGNPKTVTSLLVRAPRVVPAG